jgi:hypothetical protein
MPSIAIGRPGDHELVPVSQPLLVTGTATGKWGTEPSIVDSVTVTIAGVKVEAAVKALPFDPGKHAEPEVTFSATVPFPGTAGLQDVIATATLDDNTKETATVIVIGHEAGPMAFTPRESLQISATNPAPPSDADWAAEIVRANKSPATLLALFGNLLDIAIWHDRGDDYPICAREWNQVTAPGEDYDEEPVAFSGWLLQPEISGDDVWFTHPFGNDWECMVALDPEYTSLLAAGNIEPDGASGALALGQAAGLNMPVPDGGLLAVEADGGCVPTAFNPENKRIRVGDRIAVLGRWIVDAAHSVPVGSGKSYRAEVHPPMLMAIGGTRDGDAPTDEPVTRIMLTSRPYLVKQVYTTDTDTINKDDSPDDGDLLWHLNNEIGKLGALESLTIEAHPKIASMPFKGVHLFRLRVRPPATSGIDGVLGTQIQVSFQFTCHSGVGVQLAAADDGIDLWVVLNSVNYKPTPLPQRHTLTVTKDMLAAEGVDGIITLEQVTSGGLLESGKVQVTASLVWGRGRASAQVKGRRSGMALRSQQTTVSPTRMTRAGRR